MRVKCLAQEHNTVSLARARNLKLLSFLFSCVYSGVKLFVFAINNRRRYSIFVWFIYGLEEKNSKAEAMSSAVNVMLKGRET